MEILEIYQIDNIVTKFEIIDKLAKERTIEKILFNIYKNEQPFMDDLAQDLYVELLEMEENLLIRLYDNGAINFYLVRIIKNNVSSNTSRFVKKYKKYYKKIINIDDCYDL